MADENSNRFNDSSDPGWDDGDQVVKAINNGDKKVFKHLFEANYNPMLRFAYRYVHNEMIAEGIVQNIFLWIWENKETWEVEGKLKTYLFRAVKYKTLDHKRHERIKEDYCKNLHLHKEPLDYADIPIELVEEESEFVKAACQVIEELPDRPRMVYKLSRLEGLTYNEIADVLEISTKTVETHMSRALNILRKRLIKYLPTVLLFGSIF